MLAVILAGGFGTRLSEESHLKPKPLVEIGEKPILWHIMKNLYVGGYDRFVILAGYKAHIIKSYFLNYKIYGFDFTIKTKKNSVEYLEKQVEDWEVTILDTGYDTMTGGRLLRSASFLPKDEPFLFTYGDGLADVDFQKLRECHKNSDKLVTVTAVTPPARFGALNISENGRVLGFEEKNQSGVSLINGGFFLVNYDALQYIEGDQTSWENEPMLGLVKDQQLNAHRHHGFWQPMDTLREKHKLNKLWETGNAPWKTW